MVLPIAHNLLAAGLAVRWRRLPPTRWNRTGWRSRLLARDAALTQVATGQGGLGDWLGSGGVRVSMSTIAPETARWLADFHAERGTAYLVADDLCVRGLPGLRMHDRQPDLRAALDWSAIARAASEEAGLE